jgi:Triose-phosphate Transporter family
MLMSMSSPIVPVVATDAAIRVLPSVYNNVHFVGAAWMISSAIFTTYSTTKFLKFEPPPPDNNNNNNNNKNEADREKMKQERLPDTSKDITSSRSSSGQLSRPALLTLYRFSGSLLLGLVAHPEFRIVERILETWKLVPAFSLPALFLFLANYSNSISLDRIGISLTYTCKCSIPLVTVLLTILLEGMDALPSVPTLLTLIPIATGIAAASWDAPTFEILGFVAAMVSCVAQSALNVTCKQAMTKLGVTGSVAQRVMVAVGLVITSVLSLIQLNLASSSSSSNRKSGDVVNNSTKPLVTQKPSTTTPQRQPPAWLATMALTAYHMEYVLSFVFVKLVSPITYGACDAVRRLAIIISGHYMFGGHPFSPLNMGGIGMALCGALGYSILNSR